MGSQLSPLGTIGSGNVAKNLPKPGRWSDENAEFLVIWREPVISIGIGYHENFPNDWESVHQTGVNVSLKQKSE